MARPTKIGIPAGGAAGQVLQKSSSSDFAVEWGDGSGSGGGNTDGTTSGFLGRPYAVWSGSGLIFNVFYPVYYIQGVQYSSGSDTITLDAADATNDRYDVIAVDSTGGIKITGTPAATPIKPTVDTLTQLEITTIFVADNTLVPTLVTDENVYLENTEWTGSSDNGTVDFNNATDPFAGTKDVSCGSFTNGQYIRFVDGATNQISDFGYLKFYVKLKAQFLSSTGWIISFKNGTSTVSSSFTVTQGVYGFDRTDISGYQLIAIPLNEFTFSSATFDTVNFLLKGNNASGFRFDNIVLQGGIVVLTPGGGIVNSIVAGTNITVDNTDPANPIVSSTGGGGGHTIQDEGTPLTQRTNLNFVGSAVAVTDGGAGPDSTIVTITGGSITVGDTQVLYADGANTPVGEAAFTYNKTTNTLTVDDVQTDALELALTQSMYLITR
jgi:hypothetical protein